MNSTRLVTFVLAFMMFCQPMRAQDSVKLREEISAIESELSGLKDTTSDLLQLRKRQIELEEKKAVLEKTVAFVAKYPDKRIVADGFELARAAYDNALSLHGWSDEELHVYKLYRTFAKAMEGRLVRIEGISMGGFQAGIISKKHRYWVRGCSGDNNLVIAATVAQSTYLDVRFEPLPKAALRERDVALLHQRTTSDVCWKFEDVQGGIVLPEYTVAIEGVIKESDVGTIKLVDWVLVE